MEISREKCVNITDLVNAYITLGYARRSALTGTSSMKQLSDVLLHCDYCMPCE